MARGARVVVDDGRGAGADAAREGISAESSTSSRVERPVELPPQVLEDLDEVRRRLARDAAGEGAVEVVVGADEARHDHAAARVDEARRPAPGARSVRGRADGFHPAPFDEDGAVLDHAVVFAERQDDAVADEQAVGLGHGLKASGNTHFATRGARVKEARTGRRQVGGPTPASPSAKQVPLAEHCQGMRCGWGAPTGGPRGGGPRGGARVGPRTAEV